MAGKAQDNEGRFVVTMRLYPEQWQVDILEKRFKIMEHLQNSLIAFEKRKLKNLQHTKAWRELEQKIYETPKEKRKPLYSQRQKYLKDAGFSEFAFIDDMTPMQKHFEAHIATHVAHRAASDVWRAFDKLLYGSGRDVSFKRRGTLESVGTKTNSMTIKDGLFIWAGGRVVDHDGKKRVISTLAIRMQQPITQYEMDAFRSSQVTYRVKRQWYKNKYKWYVQITFKGNAPQRSRPIGESRVGIDIGPSSIAIVSENDVKLLELAPAVVDTHKRKVDIQRKLDRSRRAMNPENYNEDGTIKRGVKLTHNASKRYRKLQGQFRELARKEAAQRKYQHIQLANAILSLGTEVYVEDMDFAALQHRARETTINEKTGRINRKKRFGKSLANRAPAMMIQTLDNKLKALGREGILKVNTQSFKASQFDHTNGEYHKKELSVRQFTLSNGDTVQRDLYSAWLLMNAHDSLTEPDMTRCQETYRTFLELHDQEIARIKALPHRLSSFGM